MKWEQIKRQFDGEWVLIEVTKAKDETFEILEGEILYHDADEERVRNKVGELQPKAFAVRYIGEIPEDFAVML
jgi:hypothetical protein